MAKDQDSTDDSQKTEDPTQHRLEEAYKEGQVFVSREILHWLVLAGSAFLILVIFPSAIKKVASLLKIFIQYPDQILINQPQFTNLFMRTTYVVVGYIFAPFLLVSFFVILAGFLQTNFNFSFKVLQPKWERVSPMGGIKKILGKKAIIEFLKNALKVSVITASVYLSIHSLIPMVYETFLSPLEIFWPVFSKFLGRILIITLIILGFISLFDIFYQRFSYLKNLRMSRQQVKQEHKDLEGDPQVKGRMRQKRIAQMKKRMMAEVPHATAIITNPTHYAVAIKYDMDTMSAPKVIAKGADQIAKNIIEIGEQHRIPRFQNPPLARSLFERVEIAQEIHPEHYKAVADVIKLVMAMKKRRF